LKVVDSCAQLFGGNDCISEALSERYAGSPGNRFETLGEERIAGELSEKFLSRWGKPNNEATSGCLVNKDSLRGSAKVFPAGGMGLKFFLAVHSSLLSLALLQIRLYFVATVPMPLFCFHLVRYDLSNV
jgi:hypothetical protein